GHVDRGRTPCDAAPAADAPRHAELVVPGPELVGEPLAVARAGARPDRAAVDVRVVDGEARRPRPRPLGRPAGEVGRVLDARAEARRADEGAVGTGEAAARDVVPARRLGR